MNYDEQIWNIIQILFADIILSGDNALIIEWQLLVFLLN